MKQQYLVTWEFDAYADSPRAAAEEAEATQRDQLSPDGERGVFKVQLIDDDEGPDAEPETIDLAEEEE